MIDLLITNVTVMRPLSGCADGCLAVRSGRVVEQAGADRDAGDDGAVDGRGGLLTPGLIDVHTHGIHTHVFEASPDALRQGLAALPRYGTTSVCPTLYQMMTRPLLSRLEALAAVLDGPLPVHVPGLHLEGPFLALPGAGAATLPGDLGLLEEILAAAHHRVAAMSVSPETPNILPVIERLHEHGVVPFVTHTCASYEQTLDAIAAGARHATHFYDVFPFPEPCDGGVRPVGVVEAMLEDPRVTVDFIADGVHVHPGAIRLAARCKGGDGIVLITDANIGAGLGEGVHDTPWGFPVKVAPGDGARNNDPDHCNFGRLAGSVLTMDRGVNHLLDWLDLPASQVWAMATANPARLLGLTRKGSLRTGTDADMVLWETDEAGHHPVATWVAGTLVWSKRDDLVPESIGEAVS